MLWYLTQCDMLSIFSIVLQGNTALHMACYYRKMKVANWLLAKGADANVRNKVSI
jgi:ankyrin repeat protein